ncbi:MAG: glycerophosphodiester phosphodiesterase [Synechococcaceae cyanobacterium SM2_3_2]|nr:glycerophosphodiester phosphodiesterase [Synechococcaceae cyanobacterium SM2_3_2]
MTVSAGSLFADAPLIVAHRGQPGEQENTLAGFEQAIRWGSDMIELDIRRCGDGTLVVHHDADLNGIPLTQMTLEQIRQSKAVPTLAETISTVKNRIRLDVELKEAGHEATVVELLLTGLDPTQFFLTSFDAALVKSIKQQWRDVTVGLLVDAKKPLDQVALTLWADAQADILLPHWSLLPADVDLTGIPLMPWTVNDTERIRQLLQQPDILGVITDLPEQALGIRASLKQS